MINCLFIQIHKKSDLVKTSRHCQYKGEDLVWKVPSLKNPTRCPKTYSEFAHPGVQWIFGFSCQFICSIWSLGGGNDPNYCGVNQRLPKTKTTNFLRLTWKTWFKFYNEMSYRNCFVNSRKVIQIMKKKFSASVTKILANKSKLYELWYKTGRYVRNTWSHLVIQISVEYCNWKKISAGWKNCFV